MNGWRRRLALGLAFIVTGKVFDWATDGLPYEPVSWALYYGGAATVDLMMFHATGLFVRGLLAFKVEALCTASAAVNAFGYARLITADAPPDLYNTLIHGLNYVLTICLFLGDRNAMDILRSLGNSYRRFLVHCHRVEFPRRMAQKEAR